MVYQAVDEQIDVATLYQKGEVKPLIFKWGNKKYKIKKVNLVHTRYVGAIKYFFFSVSTESGEYQLKYNPDNLKWTLEEMYLE